MVSDLPPLDDFLCLSCSLQIRNKTEKSPGLISPVNSVSDDHSLREISL